jgi:hypothetical protein
MPLQVPSKMHPPIVISFTALGEPDPDVAPPPPQIQKNALPNPPQKAAVPLPAAVVDTSTGGRWAMVSAPQPLDLALTRVEGGLIRREAVVPVPFPFRAEYARTIGPVLHWTTELPVP